LNVGFQAPFFKALLDRLNMHHLGVIDVGMGVVRVWRPIELLRHDDIALLQIGRAPGKMVDYFVVKGRRNVRFGPDLIQKASLGQFDLSTFGITVESTFLFAIDNTCGHTC